MKRLTALLLALLMAAVTIPHAGAAAAQEDISVTYTAADVDATQLGEGDTFFVVLSVSAASSLWSGLWLLDYPEDVVTPIAASTTFSGNLTSMIEDTWDNDEAYSDKPAFLASSEYLGGSGEVPHGEPGNMYSLVGMYLTTNDFGGVQMGGPFVRFKYRIDREPAQSELQYDQNGGYLEFPLLTLESTHLVPGVTVGAPGYYTQHEEIISIGAKVYFTEGGSATHTVSFYGFGGELISTQQVAEGQSASAPAVPQFVETEAGAYAFYRWEEDFSSVTGDIAVHADYVLLGDVDYSGTVTSSDALLTLRAASSLITLDERRAFAADVTGDGAITSQDALKLARYVLNLIGSLTY